MNGQLDLFGDTREGKPDYAGFSTVPPAAAERLGYADVACCASCPDMLLREERGGPWVHRTPWLDRRDHRPHCDLLGVAA